MISRNQLTATVALLLTLTACGGGGGGGGSGSGGTGSPSSQPLQATGIVTDSTNGTAITGAVVDIPLQTSNPSTSSGNDGHYALNFPSSGIPQFIVGTVNKSSYLPGTVFFKYTNGQLSPYESGSNNAALVPISSIQDVVFMHGLSVTHLGDEQFSGTVNSQLQVNATTKIWDDSFHLTATQKTNFTNFTVTLYARGVESGTYCDRITLGNSKDVNTGLVTDGVPQTLSVTAINGSFTKITHTFAVSALAANADAYVQITSGKVCGNSSATDYDDFEIVAVTGRFN